MRQQGGHVGQLLAKLRLPRGRAEPEHPDPLTTYAHWEINHTLLLDLPSLLDLPLLIKAAPGGVVGSGPGLAAGQRQESGEPVVNLVELGLQDPVFGGQTRGQALHQ